LDANRAIHQSDSVRPVYHDSGLERPASKPLYLRDVIEYLAKQKIIGPTHSLRTTNGTEMLRKPTNSYHKILNGSFQMREHCID
jgi:hypothetical protein